MIQEIYNLPANMVGFKASGEVTEDDFKRIVLPQVEKLVQRTDKLNYMLVLDTSIDKFTFGAWIQDAWMGLKQLSKWHRAAIITDSENIKNFTEIFDAFMLAEFKVFEKEKQQEAIDWVSEEDTTSA